MNLKIISLLIVLLLNCSATAIASDSKDITSGIKDKIMGWFGIGSTKENKEEKKTLDKPVESKNLIQYSEKAVAQKIMDERRIYLIDLTRSMEGFNGAENIFETVKGQLASAIAELNDTTTEIVLIPFTNQPLDIYTNTVGKKSDIINYINNLSTKHGDTNILGAWNKGVEQLDSAKINYLFMLTDGVHNTGAPIEDLYKALDDWHVKTEGKYEFAFYVLLSPNANEKEICRIVDSSKQMWLVPTLNIKTDFIIGAMNLSVNIRNNNKVSMHLSCTNPQIFNDGFKFNLSIPKNEYYRIVNDSQVMDKDGNVNFEIEKLKPQLELPVSYQTTLLVNYDREKYPFVFFTPEEYNLDIVNIGTRTMTIKKLRK